MYHNVKLSALLLLFSLVFGFTCYADEAVVLIAKESTWKYLDDGSNQGTAWKTTDFDDASWSEGNGKLGYGDDNNNTTLGYGNDANNKYITTYFRKTINVNVDVNTVLFTASIVRDDGVVVYVNGKEAFRDGIPDGDITYTTLANADVSREEETTYYSYSISSDLFVQGDNIIAVEIHQTEVSSSDIGFDMELRTSVAKYSNVEPLIENEWTTFTWPYNAYLPEYEGNVSVNGRIGNSCGPTSIARVIHYWQHTPNGSGILEARDSYHGVAYHCNFDSLNLDYSNMPSSLNSTSSESEYKDIANLMYATMTIGEDIGIGYIGNEVYIAQDLVKYFYFKDTAQVVYRHDYTKEEWENIFANELENERPIIIVGRTVDSPEPGESGTVSGHYFICDGMTSDGRFYYNNALQGNNRKGYVDIDSMKPYCAHNYAIIGLQPDYNRIPEFDVDTTDNEIESGVLIAKESTWKYLDDGSNQGTAWKTTDFDDASWSEGNGKLGYGDDNNNTTLGYGNDANNKYITTYFRKTINVNVDVNTVLFTASIVRDDGVVVYINGKEAFRDGIPDGDITYTTLANADVSREEEITYYSYSISSDLFVQGDNIIAVEIHQTEVSSSDIGFDMELTCSKKTVVEADIKANRVASPIAIDGHLDEEVWDISHSIDNESEESDNSAKFGLLWNDQYLYVGVKVTDSTLCNNHRQSFYDDGIEICIDGANNKSVNFDDNDFQLGKSIRTFWSQEMQHNYDDVLQKYKEADDGYTMEFAIPWDNLNVSIAPGSSIGFNLVVNDDDESENSYNLPVQLIWIGDGNYYKSPLNWGTVELSAESVSYSSSYIALITPNDGRYLINGRTTDIEWVSSGIENVSIAYSIDNGANWTTIVESTDADAGKYEWLIDATPSDEFLIRVADAANASLADESEVNNILSSSLTASKELIPSVWQNYTSPYDAYYPGDASNACGPSSIARILHSWEFPRKGSHSLSFYDNGETYWSADFENTIYNYDKMPNYLPEDASEKEYREVATLFLHSIVSMQDIGGSGTDLDNMSYAFSHYFNYVESKPVFMVDYTPAEWTQMLINEIDSGRSMLVQGMNRDYFNDWHTSNSIGGHWYHCDGYNEEGKFHVVVGFGNYQYDGYYSIEEFPLYAYNIGVLIGLKPDFSGKTLLLNKFDNDIYVVNTPLDITWESSGISYLQLEYTLDDGLNWVEFEDSVDATSHSYSWVTPAEISGECKIRLTDVDDINIYDKSETGFELLNSELSVVSPRGKECFVYADTAMIEWNTASVNRIDIDYSTDNGTTWTPVAANVDASLKSYKWALPSIATSQGLIRISDSENESVTGVSESLFNIVPTNVVGGPYSNDVNTLVLLHGEYNMLNQSGKSDDAQASSIGVVSYRDNSVDDLGNAFYLDGSETCLTIPHNENLSLNGDWTVELWFNVESFNDGLQYLLWKPGDDDEYYANYALLISSYWGNQFFALHFADESRYGVNTQFYPEIGKWYHVAFIRDVAHSLLKVVVINSQREEVYSYSASTSAENPTINLQDVRIGYNFTGYVDEIRVSDVIRTFDDATGVEGNVLTNHLKVSPNPVKDVLAVEGNVTNDIKIYNLVGTLVKTGFVKDHTVDVSDLNTGIYIILIDSEAIRFVKK